MKAGPERLLADRYFDRFAKAGTALGLDFLGVVELAESRLADAVDRRRDEGHKLGAHLGEAALFLLDERGRDCSSVHFAEQIAAARDGGTARLAIAIGGPDGHDEALRAKAQDRIAFGAATWPHQLVRILLAEQLYRAATILANHPYHRA